MGLITVEYAETALAGLGLTSEQTAHLPAAIDAASRALERWCARSFERSAIDAVHRPGFDGLILLERPPVAMLDRVAVSLTSALAITNTASANQRATVLATLTGPAVTGVTLRRVASGVTADDVLDLGAAPTLGGLAATINAVGNGWSAEVLDSLDNWPTSELVGVTVQGAKGRKAIFSLYTTDHGDYDLDEDAGILTLRAEPYQSITAPARVLYDGGFDPIPPDVQEATVETVKAILTGLALDANLASERAGRYEYELQTDASTVGLSLPDAVLRLIAPYRLHRT